MASVHDITRVLKKQSRWLQYRLRKRWLLFEATTPGHWLSRALRRSWKVLSAAGVVLLISVIVLHGSVPVKAQSLALGTQDITDGTVPFNGVNLTNNGSTMQLQRGDIGSWEYGDGTQLLPTNANADSSITTGPNGALYVMTTMTAQCHFYRYDTEMQEYKVLTRPPEGCGAGMQIFYDQLSTIYYAPGNSSDGWYSYDIGTDAWSVQPDVPSQTGNGANFVYGKQGGKGYFYLMRGLGSTQFWRYDITGRAWTSMAAFPTLSNVNNGVSMAWDTQNTIYVYTAWEGEFKKYDIPSNTWTAISKVTQGSNKFSLEYVNGKLYQLRLDWNNERTYWRYYTIATDTWTDLPRPPIGADIYDGYQPIRYDGTRYGYVIFGTDVHRTLYRYDFQLEKWDTRGLFDQTQDDSAHRAGLVYDGVQSVYYLGGRSSGNVDKLYKYDVVTGAVTRVGSQFGTNLSGFVGVYVSGQIYFMGIESGTTFQKYDVANNTWSTLAVQPFNAGYGASIIDGGDGFLYATFQATNRFYRYNIATNTWVALTNISDTMGNGGGLTRIGRSIFALCGNSSGRFYKYNMDTAAWSQVREVPNGTIRDGGFITGDSSRYVYVDTGTRSDPGDRMFYRYDSQTDTWSRMADLPAATNVGASAIYDTVRNKVVVAQGLRQTRIFQWSPSSATYVQNGVWYSKKLDLSQVQSWTNLQSTVTGTGATILIRTSDNGNIWTDWSVVAGGVITAPVARYAQLKVTLSGNGTATPTVSGLSLNYNQEAASPSPPSIFTATKDAQDTTPLVSGQPYEHQHPVFKWNGASDGANGSGLDGYYVYYGTDSTADPVTDGNFQTGTQYTVTAPMTAGSLYYARLKVKDKLGNISPAATFFTYQYFYISPPGSAIKTSDSDFSEGTNSGVNIQNGAMQLQQQTNGAWSTGTVEPLPDNVRGGAAKVVDDFLYVMKGNNTTAFYRYNLVNRIWETLAPLPQAANDGSSLTWDKGNYLYAIRGNSTSDGFYRYNIQNGVWENLPVLPANAIAGSDMTYLGNNTIAIFFSGAREFYFYDVVTRVFSIKSSYPAGITQSGSGIWYDGNDSIYAMLGWTDFNQTNRLSLVQYSISNDSWRNLEAPSFVPANTQNNIVGDNHGGLYVFGSSHFDNAGPRERAERYDIATGTWEMLPDYPVQSHLGTATGDGDRFIYIIPSNNASDTRKIVRYDTWDKRFDSNLMAPDTWKRTPWDIPFNSNTWAQGTATTAVYDGSKYLYAIGADEGFFNRFLRYEVATGDSTYLPPPPVVGQGGSLSFSNTGTLYYLAGRNGRDFYRYDMINRQWIRLADISNAVNRPGASSLIGLVDGNMLAFAGNNRLVYKYAPGGNTWTRMTDPPANVQNGSMVYDSANGLVYVLAGNGTANFYRYNVAGNSWTTMTALPEITNNGSAMALKNGKIYAAAGNNAKNSYIYDIAGNSWVAGEKTPEEFRTGSVYVPINSDYLIGFSGDNASDFYRFNYPASGKAYEGQATHISQPIPIAGIFDYAGIKAQATISANTNVEFFTRTSTDGITWDGWQRTSETKRYSAQVSGRVNSQAKRFIQIKVVLSSYDNLYTPTVDSYALDYYYDVDPPSNPTVLNVYSDSGKQTALQSNTWYNYPQAHFDWPDPGQVGGATDGPLGSNLAGYWVYLGTDPTASPKTSGTFVTGTSYTANLSVSGSYYLRLQAQDVTGNVDPQVYGPFIYKFDNQPPTLPSLITVTPSGFSANNDFSFSWPNAFDPHSGVASYCYHTGATSGPFAAEICQAGRDLNNISAAYTTGTNVFYVRTKDNAGNFSSGYTTVSYYYSTDPPGPVTNLRAIPPSSPQNLFSYTWDLPAVFAGDPDQLEYCYSINILPSPLNSTCTGERFIAPFKSATQQGVNIIYMVAKDEAGNANWNTFASANFIANTVSPGIPLNMVVTDTSDRSSGRWSLTQTWDRPIFEGNGIDSYIVERSLDTHTFTVLGRTSTRAFVDLDVTPGTTYSYRVRAADNIDNRGGPSAVVSRAAQGAFAAPPRTVVQPKAAVGFDQANIDWVTDRDSTSFVYYGTTPTNLTQSKGSLSLAASHGQTLNGLQPSTVYYYRVQSFDNERSYTLEDAYSQIYSFRTSEPARMFNVTSGNLTFNSVDINWQSSVPTKARIEYGPGLDYGNSTDFDSNVYASEHFMRLTQLASGREYHYRIVATTEFGSTINSDDYTFTTIPRPVISTVRFQPLQDEVTNAVKVSWTTNVPTSSTVSYQGLGVALEQSLSPLVTDHEVVLRDLAGNTDYRISVQGRDQYGNLANSDPQTWRSTVDTRPPKISDVSLSVTTTQGAGNTKAQLIISWKTDEPATSQVSYDDFSADKLAKQTPLDTEPTTNHVVVISNLSLASIYKVQLESRDINGNIVHGSSTSVVTPDRESSVLDAILTILQKVFRF